MGEKTLALRCLLADLGRDHLVVAEPGDLGFGVGLGVAVQVAWFTLLQVAVLRPHHPHWSSYGRTHTHKQMELRNLEVQQETF